MKPIYRFLLIALVALMPTIASAQVQLVKSVDRSSAEIGQIFTYAIQYNLASTTQNIPFGKLEDELDPQVELVSITGSSHMSHYQYDTAAHKVRFFFINPFSAGSTGDVFVQVRFKSGTPNGHVASNYATFSSAAGVSATSNTVTTTADVEGINFTEGVYMNKYGTGTALLSNPDLYYYLRHGNTGGQDIPNYQVTDEFPAGLKLTRFTTGRFPGTNNPISVFYKTNSNPAWQQWGTGPIANSGTYSPYFYTTSLSLPASDYVTGLRFDYGTVPGGGPFHPTESGMSKITMNLTLADPSAWTASALIENCATTSGGGFSETDCSTSQLVAEYTDLSFYLSEMSSSPYEPGETIEMRARVASNSINTTPINDPNFDVLLPDSMEFVQVTGISGTAYTNAGSPAPQFSEIPNFAGTGRTLVRWSWPGLTIQPAGNYEYIDVRFEARFKPDAAYQYHRMDLFGGWQGPANGVGCSSIVDTNDYDGDQSVTDHVCQYYRNLRVEFDPGSGSAALDSVMWVKGELDTAFSKYPASALTVPGGQADYELRVKNNGDVALNNIVMIDILPHASDNGVIDLSARGSEWKPFIVGAVQAPQGVTVYYSPSKNPCRDELTPGLPSGCEDPQWSTALPTDITSVNSLKFDFGDTILVSDEEIVLAWPMRAPLNAPTSDEVAWNSFGFVADRMDHELTMLPAEPIKTGIRTREPAPPYYGDYVWNDADRDGLQDSGEIGMNGVRIDLYADNGDGISDPATDTLADFTVTTNDRAKDGVYLFTNLDPGHYFAVVHVPPGFSPSPTGAGSDDAADSDGAYDMIGSLQVAVMPVTELSPPEIDRTWDQGFFDQAALPAVWAMAEDGAGRILIGGKFTRSHGLTRNNIARLFSNGTVDPEFNPGSGTDGPIHSIAIRPDGMIVAGGAFTSYRGEDSRGIVFIDDAGDRQGPRDLPDDGQVYWAGATADSGVILAGSFHSVNGQSRQCIAKFDDKGRLDTSFASGAGSNGDIYCAALQEDGRILIGGDFRAYAGATRNYLARLNPDGSLDTTFDPGPGTDGPVRSVRIDPTGTIMITGDFTSCHGQAANGTSRIQPNGSLDTDFGASPLKVNRVNQSK